MDRYPIDESSPQNSDDGAPTASDRPAVEWSNTQDNTGAVSPPEVAPSPIPPAPAPPPASASASVFDRPAGHNSSTAPVPISGNSPSTLPPPPPSAGMGSMPPTVPWERPPFSATPPSPAAYPAAAAVGLSGPPTTSPASASFEPLPLGSNGGRWRVAAGALGGMAFSAVLVAGGFGLAQIVDDDPMPVPEVTEDAGPTELAMTDNEVAAPTIVPAPLTDADAVEPIAAVAQAISPSVVLIETGVGQGSGIVWDAVNGYIVTNDHVAGDATTVTVRFDNGVEVVGMVIGGDAARDIAVVQVDPTEVDLVAAVFAPTASVDVGQLAVAVGSPFGLDQSVTAGIVSAVNRINPFGGSDPDNPVPVAMIQTDAPINPGNSGGALADRQGRVIGMNTSIRTGGASSDNAGVGFAVPSDTIVLIAQRIVNGESLELGFLGVSGDTLTDGTMGAIVTGVVEGAPAEEAGMEVGDLIISVNGEVVRTMEELAAVFKFFRPGELVDIVVLRDGARMTFPIVVGSN